MKPYRGLDPWRPNPETFPVRGTDSEQLLAGLDWAILAPSGHNTQPWLFRQTDGHLDVLADRTKRLAVADPEDRELIMACAAATTHLDIAMRRFGRKLHIDWFPQQDDADLVARVRLAEPTEPDSDDVAMFDAISRRQTNRAPFRGDAISADTLTALDAIADAADARLTILTGDQKTEVAELIAQGDWIQMADRTFRRELASWVHHDRTDHADGMRGYAFDLSDLVSHLGPHIIRTFDVGKGQAAKDRDLALHSPALLVIETDTDTPTDWTSAGCALDRILLKLTANELAASFLNQPIEVPHLRDQLAETLRTNGHPQILLRIGSPTENQTHAPRIPADGRTRVPISWPLAGTEQPGQSRPEPRDDCLR